MSVYCWYSYKSPKSVSKSQNYIAFLMAIIRVIYLALIDDSAIIDCFFEYQLIGSLFDIKIKADIYFQLFLSFA